MGGDSLQAPAPPGLSANPPAPSAPEALYPTVNITDLLQPPGRLTRPANLVIILRGPPGSGELGITAGNWRV